MAKDSLTDAIFELKDRGRNSGASAPKRKRKPVKQRNDERPRAFDSFHTFSVMLLVFGGILQVVALVLYA